MRAPRAMAAGHMCVSAVRAPSCVGRLPVRLLLERDLRARGAPAGGERSEREGAERGGRGEEWEVWEPCANPTHYRPLSEPAFSGGDRVGAELTVRCRCSCRRKP